MKTIKFTDEEYSKLIAYLFEAMNRQAVEINRISNMECQTERFAELLDRQTQKYEKLRDEIWEFYLNMNNKVN